MNRKKIKAVYWRIYWKLKGFYWDLAELWYVGMRKDPIKLFQDLPRSITWKPTGQTLELQLFLNHSGDVRICYALDIQQQEIYFEGHGFRDFIALVENIDSSYDFLCAILIVKQELEKLKSFIEY